MTDTTQPRLRLTQHAYAELCRRHGWASDEQAAAALGVAGSTLRRALRGTTSPGEGLLAALAQQSYPDLGLSQLTHVQ